MRELGDGETLLVFFLERQICISITIFSMVAFCSTTQTLEELTTHAASVGSR